MIWLIWLSAMTKPTLCKDWRKPPDCHDSAMRCHAMPCDARILGSARFAPEGQSHRPHFHGASRQQTSQCSCGLAGAGASWCWKWSAFDSPFGSLWVPSGPFGSLWPFGPRFTLELFNLLVGALQILELESRCCFLELLPIGYPWLPCAFGRQWPWASKEPMDKEVHAAHRLEGSEGSKHIANHCDVMRCGVVFARGHSTSLTDLNILQLFSAKHLEILKPPQSANCLGMNWVAFSKLFQHHSVLLIIDELVQILPVHCTRDLKSHLWKCLGVHVLCCFQGSRLGDVGRTASLS